MQNDYDEIIDVEEEILDDLEPEVDNSFELETKALLAVTTALQPLTPESRAKVIESVMTLLGGQSRVGQPQHVRFAPAQSVVGPVQQSSTYNPAGGSPINSFSEDRTQTPKEFILHKNPQTDAERVMCLAFYLEHYRDMPKFKTIDISKLNTEAAQRKFSNAALTLKNAVSAGYLISVGKGQRQLSAEAEQFVLALPDRDAAKAVFSRSKSKRKTRSKKKSNGNKE